MIAQLADRIPHLHLLGFLDSPREAPPPRCGPLVRCGRVHGYGQVSWTLRRREQDKCAVLASLVPRGRCLARVAEAHLRALQRSSVSGACSCLARGKYRARGEEHSNCGRRGCPPCPGIATKRVGVSRRYATLRCRTAGHLGGTLHTAHQPQLGHPLQPGGRRRGVSAVSAASRHARWQRPGRGATKPGPGDHQASAIPDPVCKSYR
jgi:hypothetical protein